MKKSLYTLSLAFVAVSLLLVSGCKKKEPVVVEAVATEQNDMPALFVTNTDDKQVYLKDAKGNTVLVFFSPDCDHCQREAKMISENTDIFKGYNVFFIAADSLPVISKFAIDYNLTGHDNIQFAHADGMEVFRSMGAINNVPLFVVYRNERIVARVDGEVALPRLKQILQVY